jgi:hypothetical protein
MLLGAALLVDPRLAAAAAVAGALAVLAFVASGRQAAIAQGQPSSLSGDAVAAILPIIFVAGTMALGAGLLAAKPMLAAIGAGWLALAALGHVIKHVAFPLVTDSPVLVSGRGDD